MHNKYSLKASVTSELVFQDCRIPKDRLLPNVGGLRDILCLNNARYGISWGALGAWPVTIRREHIHSPEHNSTNHSRISTCSFHFAWMLREITKDKY